MMGNAVVLRDDFDAAGLRKLARKCKDTRAVRRLLALAAVYDGASRSEAAKAGGMDRQSLRDWVIARDFDVHVSEATVGRLLHRLGFAHVSARPRHPGQNVEAIAAFKKTSKPKSATG